MALKVFSKEADFCSLAARCMADTDVKLYIESDQYKKAFEGILDKADSATGLDIQPDDVVVFDEVGAGDGADVLSKKGYNVVSGSSIGDKMELDRPFGASIMEKAGIQTPPTFKFDNFDEGKKFIEKTMKRYVFKPNGNPDVELTFVPSSPEGLLAMWRYLTGKLEPGSTFELQEFVSGVEMSTEAWFTGSHFLLPINSTMEEKRLGAGNTGQNTGCMGNVVWFWDDQTSAFLYNYLFQPLEPFLKKNGYVGPLDINGIWNDQGIFALEWTARFGYDAILACSRLIKGSFYKFLRDYKTMDMMPVEANPDLYGMTVRCCIPPYPYKDMTVPMVPILGLNKGMMDNIYLADAMIDLEKQLSTAGTDGYALSIGEDGRDVQKLRRKIYSIMEEIDLPSKTYRNDIGERVLKDKPKIEGILKRLASKR
jgi:phosphoribosylamine---glycine ligase